MHENRLISVIIPAYNSGKYIGKCLDSVLLPELSDIEVIVVNDGSTDETGGVCKKYSEDERLIYIEQENKGQGAARNVAIDASNGEWIVFLDSDDELNDDALIVILDYIHKNPDADLILYGNETHTLGGEIKTFIYPKDVKDTKELLKNTTTFLWDKAVRKDLWKRLDIRLDNCFGEDISASYLCQACSQKFVVIEKILVKHFLRGENLSCSSEKVIEIVQSIRNVFDNFKMREILNDFEAGLANLVSQQMLVYKKTDAFKMDAEKRAEIAEKIEVLGNEYLDWYEAVVIGNDDFEWVEAIHDIPVVSRYEDIEKFVVAKEDRGSKKQIYFIDLKNEFRTLKFGVRSESWYRNRETKKISEFKSEALRRGIPQKIIILDELGKYDSNKEISSLCETEIIKKTNGQLKIYPEKENVTLKSFQYVDHDYWNEGEQYRYELNESILAAWLRMSQEGRNLTEFFWGKGYKAVGIYGMGYMGKLLYEELKEGGIGVSCLMENQAGRYQDMNILQIGDNSARFDVMVVTLANLYLGIKHDIRCIYGKKDVISIGDVIEEMIDLGDKKAEVNADIRQDVMVKPK